ncbi:MAG: hypothetical protein ACK55Z_24085, partial [bacterium]
MDRLSPHFFSYHFNFLTSLNFFQIIKPFLATPGSEWYTNTHVAKTLPLSLSPPPPPAGRPPA